MRARVKPEAVGHCRAPSTSASALSRSRCRSRSAVRSAAPPGARPSRCRDRQCAAAGCAVRPRRSRRAPLRPPSRSPAAAPASTRRCAAAAPEFLAADDARHRLALDPPRRNRHNRAASSPPRRGWPRSPAPVWSRPSAWPIRSRASSSGLSRPARRNTSASARRASVTVIPGASGDGRALCEDIHQYASAASSSA